MKIIPAVLWEREWLQIWVSEYYLHVYYNELSFSVKTILHSNMTINVLFESQIRKRGKRAIHGFMMVFAQHTNRSDTNWNDSCQALSRIPDIYKCSINGSYFIIINISDYSSNI